MAAYRQVHVSRHLQADCQKQGSAPKPYTLDNRVWATFTFSLLGKMGVEIRGGANDRQFNDGISGIDALPLSCVT